MATGVRYAFSCSKCELAMSGETTESAADGLREEFTKTHEKHRDVKTDVAPLEKE